jgi:hypothetical protein
MAIAGAVKDHRTARRPAPRRGAPDLRLERRADGQLWASIGGTHTKVTVLRCFPWSEPTRFVSLRDRDEEEVALIRDASDLDSSSREALELSLVEAGFVFEIEAILDLEEEIEIRSWVVHTQQGSRRFQTPRDEWPRELPDGGLLIRDVAGDLFRIADPEALDDRSQKHLWVFVD